MEEIPRSHIPREKLDHRAAVISMISQSQPLPCPTLAHWCRPILPHPPPPPSARALKPVHTLLPTLLDGEFEPDGMIGGVSPDAGERDLMMDRVFFFALDGRLMRAAVGLQELTLSARVLDRHFLGLSRPTLPPLSAPSVGFSQGLSTNVGYFCPSLKNRC